MQRIKKDHKVKNIKLKKKNKVKNIHERVNLKIENNMPLVSSIYLVLYIVVLFRDNF